MLIQGVDEKSSTVKNPPACESISPRKVLRDGQSEWNLNDLNGGEMVVDGERNFVYVSDLLAGRFPSIYEGLERILGEHGIGFGVVGGTKDIWIRDYAPIQVDENGSFVLFQYFPDYLRDEHRHLITDADGMFTSLPGVRSCEVSGIVLDGGNVVRHRDKAIVTDKVFPENRGIGPVELRQELRRLLRVETLVEIPVEPGDEVGHADGVVRFVDGSTVVINDYRRVDVAYRRVLRRKLGAAGLNMVEIAYCPDLDASTDIPSAVGNYVNYLQVGGLLVVSSYGQEEDLMAREALSRVFPTNSIRTLPSLGRRRRCPELCHLEHPTAVDVGPHLSVS
jgi:agmatine deiminase